MYAQVNFFNKSIFFIAVFLLLAACGSDPNDADSGGTKVKADQSCTKADACEDGFECVGTSGSYTCVKGCTLPAGRECTALNKTCVSSEGPSGKKNACTGPGASLGTTEIGGDCSSEGCVKGLECVDVGSKVYKCVKGCNDIATADCQGQAFVCVDATNKVGTATKACIGNPKDKLTEYKQCTSSLVASMKAAISTFDSPIGPVKSAPVTVKDSPNPNHPTVTSSSDYTEVTFVSGKAILSLQETSAFYLNLNNTDDTVKVDISDEAAFTTNTDWQVAFRYYDFFVNGGAFPGNYEIAWVWVKNNPAAFNEYTKADAMALTEDDFKIPAIVTTSCELNKFSMLDAVPALITAPSILANSENPYKMYYPWAPYGAQHLPHPESEPGSDHFYIIKKVNASDWYAKLRVQRIFKANPDEKDVSFTIQYKVLQ